MENNSILGYDEDDNALKPMTIDNVSHYSLFIVDDDIPNINEYFEKNELENAYLMKHDQTGYNLPQHFDKNKIIHSNHISNDRHGIPTVYAQVGKDIESGQGVYEKVLNHMENALQTAANSRG